MADVPWGPGRIPVSLTCSAFVVATGLRPVAGSSEYNPCMRRVVACSEPVEGPRRYWAAVRCRAWQGCIHGGGQ